MRHEKERALAGFARQQFGIASRSQLFDVRLTRKQVDYLLRSRRLERMYQSVYRVAGCPSSWEQNLLAACWAGGERSIASHRAAAALWQLPCGVELLEITAPRGRRSRHNGIIAHESKRFDPLDITVVKGAIPVTRPARTFLDLCALVELGELDRASAELGLQEAIRRDLVDIALVGTRLERLGGEYRLGGRTAQELIDRWLPAIARTDSRPEARLLRIFEAHGIPMPVPQYRLWLGPDECVDIDLAWPEVRAGIEFDSYRYHGGRMKYDDDARRALRVRSRRFELIRITDAELDAELPNALPIIKHITLAEPASPVRRSAPYVGA